MIYKDYYKVPGVEMTTTPAEIKKAYRTLANRCHPDQAMGDKAAEEKFKDVNEANEVLRENIPPLSSGGRFMEDKRQTLIVL